MATKLKKLTYKPATKALALLIALGCLIAGGQIIANILILQHEYYSESGTINGTTWYGRYSANTSTQDSFAFNYLVNYGSIAQTIAAYESVDKIKSGELYDEVLAEVVEGVAETEAPYVESKVTGERFYNSEYNGMENASEEAKFVEIQHFQYALSSLEESGISYSIRTGNRRYSDGDLNKKYQYEIKDNKAIFSISGKEESLTYNPNISGEDYVLLATDAEVFTQLRSNFFAYQAQLNDLVVALIIIAIVGLLMIVILSVGAGRKATDNGKEVHLSALDKVPLDLSLTLAISITAVGTIGLATYLNWLQKLDYTMAKSIAFALSLFVFVLGTLWYLSFVRQAKVGGWWRNTLVWKLTVGVFQWCKNKILKIWNGISNKIRYLIFTAVVIFLLMLSVIPPALIVTIPLALVILFFLFRDMERVIVGAKEIEQGNYHCKIDVKNGQLGTVARLLENISNNMDSEVKQRLQSELYRTELITNVSHDLRTPLTSLITYTDLLKTKGLDSPEAPEYLEVLIQKSHRLKALTDDLFEATKAATGNISVSLEPLSLEQLVEQCLGEFDEQIGKSDLSFITSLSSEAVVLADGSLMWRVLENLFSNVFKYSMPGTRVYVDSFVQENSWCLEIKNISNFPLNVPTEELTDRFRRGDSARTSEGSGLGLSIVESFVLAQNGNFAVSVDGDLFKVAVCLPKTYSPLTPSTPSQEETQQG